MHACMRDAVLSTSPHLGTAARSPAGAKLSRSPLAAPKEALVESADAVSLTPVEEKERDNGGPFRPGILLHFSLVRVHARDCN